MPASAVADRDLGTTIVVRLNATLMSAHSDKQQAAATFKWTWGHHRLTAWCDNTGENLALLLRAGSAGSTTVADHITPMRSSVPASPAIVGPGLGGPHTEHPIVTFAGTDITDPDPAAEVAAVAAWLTAVRAT